MTIRPNKANIRKWVRALRSGKYRQTQCVLRVNDGVDGKSAFCCLGVACEISGLGKWTGDDDTEVVYRVGKAKSSSVLPPPVRRWLGVPVKEGDPVFSNGHTATNLNDDYGYSFKRIASAIEKTYLKPKKRAVR